MSELPVQITNKNLEITETSSNNSNNTLSTKQRREQAAKELGISYDESLKMSQSELDKRVADPNYDHKKRFLEAHTTSSQEAEDAMAAIDYMTSDTPETLPNTPQTTVIDSVDAPTEVLPTVLVDTVDQTALESDQVSKKDYLFSLAKEKLFSIYTGSRNAELRESGRQSIEEGKKIRGGLKYVIGAVGIFAATAVVTRYTGLGFEETAHAVGITDLTGATGGTGATGVTEHHAQIGNTPGTTAQEASSSHQNGTHYNRFEQHSHDRMSTHGAFDGTERTSAELDDHVLAKIRNNPSLMSSVLEVRKSGNKDANFSLDDVNHDTHKFSVHGENGEYSSKGEDAAKTLEKSWNNGHQGRLLSDERVANIMKKYEFINHGTDEGKFKNALDDKTYSAGVFNYRPELGDQIYGKELGNGEVVYFKVNERDSSRDCLNVLTLREIGVSTPYSPEGGTTPPNIDVPLTPKGKVYVDSHGPADIGDVRADGPGKKEPHQQAGGQTDTQAEQKANPGGTADGATNVEKPGNASQGASGQTSNGNVGE